MYSNLLINPVYKFYTLQRLILYIQFQRISILHSLYNFYKILKSCFFVIKCTITNAYMQQLLPFWNLFRKYFLFLLKILYAFFRNALTAANHITDTNQYICDDARHKQQHFIIRWCIFYLIHAGEYYLITLISNNLISF